MKILLIALLVLTISSVIFAQQGEILSREEIVKYNNSLSDQEITKYFEFLAKYDPVQREELARRSESEWREFINEYRNAFNEAGMQMQSARDFQKLTDEERAELEIIVKQAAEYHIRERETKERMHSYSLEEFGAILNDGKTLIGNYHEDDYSLWQTIDRKEDIPESIAAVDPQFLRVGEDWCDIYLNKGIGVGTGYGIRKNRNDQWELYWFTDMGNSARQREGIILTEGPHKALKPTPSPQ